MFVINDYMFRPQDDVGKKNRNRIFAGYDRNTVL